MSSGVPPGIYTAPGALGAAPDATTGGCLEYDRIANAAAANTATTTYTARHCTYSASTADSETPAKLAGSTGFTPTSIRRC